MANKYGYDAAAYDAALAALKAEVGALLPPQPMYTEAYLGRFLRARKLNVPKAKAMLVANLQWRKTNGADTVLSGPAPDPRMVQAHPHGFLGFGRNGCPVFIERTGKSALPLLLPHLSSDAVMHWKVYFQEQLQRLMREAHTEQCIAVMDMDGLSLKQATKQALDFYKLTGAVDEANYPEELNCVFVINASTIFTTLWKVVKHFFDEGVRSKVRILGRDYAAELHQAIAPEELPPFLGGTRQECPAWCGELSYLKQSGLGYTASGMTVVKIAAGSDYCFDASSPSGTLAWQFSCSRAPLRFSVRRDKSLVVAETRVEDGEIGCSGSLPAAVEVTYTLVWSNDSADSCTLSFRVFSDQAGPAGPAA
eukprot:RCo041227